MAYGVQNFETFDNVGTRFDTEQEAEDAVSGQVNPNEWRVIELNDTCTDYECNCYAANESCGIYY